MYTCQPMSTELSAEGTSQDNVNHLLISWNLPQLCQKFQEEQISEQALRCLNADDISELIPKVGPRAIFRYELQKWKQCESESYSRPTPSYWPVPIKEGLEDFELLLYDDKESRSETPDKQVLSVHDILHQCAGGKEALKFYNKNNYLDSQSRRLCAEAIVNTFIERNIKMAPNSFQNSAQQLIEMFPSEHLETFYIPRRGLVNPKGMLHNKYFNTMRRKGLQGLRRPKKSDK